MQLYISSGVSEIKENLQTIEKSAMHAMHAKTGRNT